MPIHGSVPLLLGMAVVYLFALLSLGLLVSSRAHTPDGGDPDRADVPAAVDHALGLHLPDLGCRCRCAHPKILPATHSSRSPGIIIRGRGFVTCGRSFALLILPRSVAVTATWYINPSSAESSQSDDPHTKKRRLGTRKFWRCAVFPVQTNAWHPGAFTSSGSARPTSATARLTSSLLGRHRSAVRVVSDSRAVTNATLSLVREPAWRTRSAWRRRAARRTSPEQADDVVG